MTLGIENTGILASASLALFSILVAVIAILFSIYSGLSKESYIRDPFKDLINFMTCVLIIAGITCFSSIACLLGVSHVSVYYLTGGLLILLVLLVVIGVFIIKKEVLKHC
jgi:hypothetical protein